MNTVELNPVAAAAAEVAGAAVAPAVVVAFALNDDQTRAVVGAAVDLSNADRQFESAIGEVAKAVARVMGTDPSFELWTAVQSAFVTRYTEARECKEETSRLRWVKIAAVMEAEFALEKPAKPTKAAEVKAKQREGAAAEAAAIIEAAKATTPAEVLALMAPTEGTPVKPQVAAALAAESTRMAKEASKAANEAARAEVKALQEQIRKALPSLKLETLRAIQALLPKADAPAETPAPEAATA